MKNVFALIVILLLAGQRIKSQITTTLSVYPDSVKAPVNNNFGLSTFSVPKTLAAFNDLLNNGIKQKVMRINVIESVLNNATNLNQCLSLLDAAEPNIQALSARCDKLIFIIEKMPLWLSSSTDGTPVTGVGGYYVFNTKPPANWNTWQTAIDSVTSRIINKMGIANAIFEIWNEPDVGTWSGSMADYFKLWKTTYNGIKSASSTAKIGGPTTNNWPNNIYWEPPLGYVPNNVADSSLIGMLLDSTAAWNMVPDFISFHLFNLMYQSYSNAADYIKQKCALLSVPVPSIIVSEWNAPSNVRDKPLATSWMVKSQIELSNTSISGNSIAAWQDFNQSSIEFHNDYGLLTYGAIHKPAYYSVLLAGKLDGNTCKTISSNKLEAVASVSNDSLTILISNYCPLPFAEAVDHTLYEGKFTINDLHNAGYINLSTSNFLKLDSIYRSLIILPGSNPLQLAINNSISVYQHYSSIFTTTRSINLSLNGYNGSYVTKYYLIDSTRNNMQYKYDSLLAASYTQTNAINAILPIQGLKNSMTNISGGQLSFTLQPNAVCLFKIHIPGIIGVKENHMENKRFKVFPNPFSSSTTLKSDKPFVDANLTVYNSIGQEIKQVKNIKGQEVTLQRDDLPVGIYFARLTEEGKIVTTYKIVIAD